MGGGDLQLRRIMLGLGVCDPRAVVETALVPDVDHRERHPQIMNLFPVHALLVNALGAVGRIRVAPAPVACRGREGKRERK